MTAFGRENRYRDMGHEISWIYHENQEVKRDSPRCQICRPVFTLIFGLGKNKLEGGRKSSMSSWSERLVEIQSSSTEVLPAVSLLLFSIPRWHLIINIFSNGYSKTYLIKQ